MEAPAAARAARPAETVGGATAGPATRRRAIVRSEGRSGHQARRSRHTPCTLASAAPPACRTTRRSGRRQRRDPNTARTSGRQDSRVHLAHRGSVRFTIRGSPAGPHIPPSPRESPGQSLMPDLRLSGDPSVRSVTPVPSCGASPRTLSANRRTDVETFDRKYAASAKRRLPSRTRKAIAHTCLLACDRDHVTRDRAHDMIECQEPAEEHPCPAMTRRTPLVTRGRRRPR